MASTRTAIASKGDARRGSAAIMKQLATHLRDGDFPEACNVFAFLAEVGDCEAFKEAQSVLWNIQKRSLHRLIVALESAARRMTHTTLLLKAIMAAPSANFVRRVIQDLRDEPAAAPEWSMGGKLGYRFVSAAISEGLVDGALELLQGGCPTFYSERIMIKENGKPEAECWLPRCLFGAASIVSPDGRFALCDLLHVPELVEEVNAEMPSALPALLGAAAADGAVEIVQTVLERGIVHPDCIIQREDFTAIGQRRPAYWCDLERVFDRAGEAEPWAEFTPARLLLLRVAAELRRGWYRERPPSAPAALKARPAEGTLCFSRPPHLGAIAAEGAGAALAESGRRTAAKGRGAHRPGRCIHGAAARPHGARKGNRRAPFVEEAADGDEANWEVDEHDHHDEGCERDPFPFYCGCGLDEPRKPDWKTDWWLQDGLDQPFELCSESMVESPPLAEVIQCLRLLADHGAALSFGLRGEEPFAVTVLMMAGARLSRLPPPRWLDRIPEVEPLQEDGGDAGNGDAGVEGEGHSYSDADSVDFPEPAPEPEEEEDSDADAAAGGAGGRSVGAASASAAGARPHAQATGNAKSQLAASAASREGSGGYDPGKDEDFARFSAMGQRIRAEQRVRRHAQRHAAWAARRDAWLAARPERRRLRREAERRERAAAREERVQRHAALLEERARLVEELTAQAARAAEDMADELAADGMPFWAGHPHDRVQEARAQRLAPLLTAAVELVGVVKPMDVLPQRGHSFRPVLAEALRQGVLAGAWRRRRHVVLARAVRSDPGILQRRAAPAPAPALEAGGVPTAARSDGSGAALADAAGEAAHGAAAGAGGGEAANVAPAAPAKELAW